MAESPCGWYLPMTSPIEMAMHYHLVDIHHKSKHAVHYHSTELIEHINEVLDCDEAEEK